MVVTLFSGWKTWKAALLAVGVGTVFGVVEAVLIVTLKVSLLSMEPSTRLANDNRVHTTGELNGQCYSLAL